MWQSSRPASFSAAGLTLWPNWLECWLATLSGLPTQVRIPVGLLVPGRYIGGSSAGLGKAQRIDSSLRADWLSCFSLAWWEWRSGLPTQVWIPVGLSVPGRYTYNMAMTAAEHTSEFKLATDIPECFPCMRTIPCLNYWIPSCRYFIGVWKLIIVNNSVFQEEILWKPGSSERNRRRDRQRNSTRGKTKTFFWTLPSRISSTENHTRWVQHLSVLVTQPSFSKKLTRDVLYLACMCVFCEFEV